MNNHFQQSLNQQQNQNQYFNNVIIEQNQLAQNNQQLQQNLFINYQQQQIPQQLLFDQQKSQQQPQQSLFTQSVLQLNSSMQQYDEPEHLKKLRELQQQQLDEKNNYSYKKSTFQFEPRTNFDDDDKIISNLQENAPAKPIMEQLELDCKSLYSQGKLFKTQEQRLPGTVSIKVSDNENQGPSSGLDLICVIDISGSMCGEKILNVKKTLISLLDFLTEKDRLCLILYDDSGKRLTPLKVVNEKNKEYFKNAILYIRASGGNIMPNGTKLAYQQVSERKYRNDVTAIFLLSDGIEDHECADQVKIQHEKCKETLSLYTFGFGSDHDPILMSKICKIGKGSFYFVNNVSLLDEFFADAIGGLVSAIGENLQLEIKCYPQQPFQDIKIGQCYGDMWIKKEEGRHYQINQSYLVSGLRKDYVFELLLPKYNDQIQDNQRQVVVVEVNATFFATELKQQINKSAHLIIRLFNENEDLAIENQEQDWDVYAQYLRVQATDCIEAARQACEKQQFNQAEEMLNNFQQRIESNPQQQEKAKNTLQDIIQAKQGCKIQNYHNYGKKQMIQMHSNNYQQQGMTAQFDQMGMQTNDGQASYSNQTQQIFVQNMKKYKKTMN